MLIKPPAKDWLMWRRTYDAHGFSPLRKITPANVKDLKIILHGQSYKLKDYV